MVLKTFGTRLTRLGSVAQTVLLSLTVVGIVAVDALQAMVEKIPTAFTAVDLLTGAVLTLQLYVIKRVGDHEKLVVPQLATMVERLEHMPTKEQMITSIQETRHAIRGEVHAVVGELDEKIIAIDNRVSRLQEEA
ncbi:hypothetical protein LCGC14_2702410 [marine sediment metagenome]|uniref:Uncharacterized protein n=1 Tax=marine sediment metagenome TaxID=412755 RepID=A0A0F8ZFA7_9ZZZZ